MPSTVTFLDGETQYEVRVLEVVPGPINPRTHRWMFRAVNVELAAIRDKDGSGDIKESSCNDTEKDLGHIPNPRALKRHQSHFSWEHRTLVKVRNLEAGKNDGVEWADYFMWVCLDKNQGFPLNYLLEELEPEGPKVYGAAFVFKKTTDSGGPDDEEIAAYLQTSDDDFNDDDKISRLENRILKKMMKPLKSPHLSCDDQSVEYPPH